MALWAQPGFKHVFEATDTGMALWSQGFAVLAANPAWCRMLGYTREELQGMTYVDFTHPDDLQKSYDYQAAFDPAGGEPAILEKRHIRKDGGTVWVTLRSTTIRTDEGEFLCVLTLISNETARKLAEQALTAQEHTLRTVLASAPEGVVVADSHGTIVLINATTERLFDYTREELIGMSVQALVPDALRDRHEQLRASFVSPSDARTMVGNDLDIYARRKDGTEFPVEISLNSIRLNDAPHVLAMVRDMTTKKAQAERSAQSQRLEAIGRLAGGVAHDFNNILTVIQGHGSLLRNSLEKGAAEHMSLAAIVTAAERGAALTRQLLTFGRRQPIETRVIDVNSLVAKLETMLRRTLGEDIRLETQLNTSWNVLADPAQLEQAVMNLAINARDAMPDGGSLTIETLDAEGASSPCAGYENTFSLTTEMSGRYVHLRVSDSGVGMTKDTLAHVFEPYFTKKAPGEGTGLGLPSVYGFVEQLGGAIQVGTEVNKGTCFDLFLPCAVGARQTDDETIASPLVSGQGTVLVVEDDPHLMTLTTLILEEAGYSVLRAATPQAALTDFVKTPVDLIVSDVVMPGMSGPTFIQEWEAARGPARVLYMSGYAGGTIRTERVSLGDFLAKPFTADQLTERVGKAMSRGGDKMDHNAAV